MDTVTTVLVNGGMAAVLLLSGVLKVVDGRTARTTWRQLGLPAALVDGPAPRLWPAVEIGLAAGLLLVPAPWSTLTAGLVLVVTIAFLTITVRILRRGEAVACRCFGAADAAPIDRSTVARNAGLVLLAALGWAGSGHGSVLGLALTLDPLRAAIVQVAVLGVAVLVGLRLTDRLRDRTRTGAEDGVGTSPSLAVPDATTGYQLGRHLLPDLFGAQPDVRRFVGPDRSVLVFLSLDCSNCRELANELPAWRAELADRGIALRAVTAHPAARALVTFPALGAFLHQDADDRLATSLGITAVPAAVYVGADGTPTVSEGPVAGPYAIADLVANLRLTAPVTTAEQVTR